MGMFKKNQAVGRILVWVTLVLSIFLIASCSIMPNWAARQKEMNHNDLKAWMENNGKVKVCATNPIIAASVSRVGGTHVDVISLINPKMDPHSYEIVKGDADKLARADIIVANGLSLEHSGSMQRTLSSMPNVVFLADGIPQEEIIYVNGAPDPHIWMDLRLWAKTNSVIVDALTKKDPKHAADYKENAEMAKRLYALNDKKIYKQIQSISPRERYLVSSHDAFHYFARRYMDDDGDWSTRIIAIYGLAPDEQISAVEIRNVVKFVNEHNVRVIFAEKNLSRDSLLKVVDSCRKSGIDVVLAKDELYGDNLGKYTYIEMMNHNADVLEANLKKKPAKAKEEGGCGCS